MTLRDELLPVFETVARQIPVDLGLRTHTVKVRTITWSGGEVQLGTASNATTTITPAPRVRQVDGLRSIIVGPITPDYSAGGYTPLELNPANSAGVEAVYLVTGPDAVEREYAIVRFESKPTDSGGASGFGYLVHLESTDRRNPY